MEVKTLMAVLHGGSYVIYVPISFTSWRRFIFMLSSQKNTWWHSIFNFFCWKLWIIIGNFTWSLLLHYINIFRSSLANWLHEKTEDWINLQFSNQTTGKPFCSCNVHSFNLEGISLTVSKSKMFCEISMVWF